MTTEEWFDGLTAELLAQSPFRRSDYFKRFASGTLTRDQVWAHIAQHYLLIAWFPRIFSGIHTRCEDLEVRKDCARHLLVEDLGYFEGRVGGTPDHDELFRRIGDDLGYGRDEYARIVAVPEMAAIVDFFRRLAHEVPWNAALCATALLEEEVVEIAQTVGGRRVPPDLYVSFRRGEEWTDPQPLGGGVNTGATENFVTISPDGRHLYFVRDFAGFYRAPLERVLPASR